MTKFAVLCPGPSLKELTERPEGTLVAINRAIWHPIKADIFCAQDAPYRLSLEKQHLAPEKAEELGVNPDMVEEVRRLQPKLWVSSRNPQRWNEAGFPEYQEFSIWKPELDWLMGSRGKTILMNRSFCLALLGCLHSGATEITMYGCDEKGQSYFTGCHGDKWGSEGEGRWKRERVCLDKIILQAAEQGITITRHRT